MFPFKYFDIINGGYGILITNSPYYTNITGKGTFRISSSWYFMAIIKNNNFGSITAIKGGGNAVFVAIKNGNIAVTQGNSCTFSDCDLMIVHYATGSATAANYGVTIT